MGPSGTGERDVRSPQVTRVEEQLRDVLQTQLRLGEVLLTSVRITDPRDGDVEIDMIVLFPDAGAAVIEVKGGEVRFADGGWTTNSKKYSRRIHPTEQARKAKHALRRYLDRQPEWNRPLLRCEWFVAMPQTQVTGDMGPEGHRDRLIGSNDLSDVRDRLRAPLISTLNTDALPAPGWTDDVLTLLLRVSDANQPAKPPRRSRRTIVATVAAAAAGVGLVLGGWWLVRNQATAEVVPTSSATASAATGVAGACAEGYEPCLPQVDDLDCTEIKKAVTVTGDDPYGLDRDGDGKACESFG